MPEQLLGRIIKVSSNPGELVLDPFAGSGTTLVVAKKLGRRWIGFELSKKYAGKAEERLAGTSEGEALVGSEDPVNSAPTTANGKRLAVVAPPMLRKLPPAYRTLSVTARERTLPSAPGFHESASPVEESIAATRERASLQVHDLD